MSRQLDILFEYSWDYINRQADRVCTLWKATGWTLNVEKWKHMLDLEVQVEVLQEKKEVCALGKVTVCAEPEIWVTKYEPSMEQ